MKDDVGEFLSLLTKRLEQETRYPVIEEIQELNARQVAKLLHRSPKWVAEHAAEMGGVQDRPKGRWHFVPFGIRAYQERRMAGRAG